jgi:hypothetical protein
MSGAHASARVTAEPDVTENGPGPTSFHVSPGTWRNSQTRVDPTGTTT